ncbi:MAG TPA: AraC family transcriptional regulator [Candidatus Polarisedimenticolaceae bacterium]|nr:AraC family transcriptional regulator [Candidatus Polarisedimenticolaceae bacterium]
MSRDTLSEVLRSVRLRGAVFYYVDGSSPWIVEAPPAAEIIPAIMPAAEHMIEFHGVVEGSCWAAIVGEPPVRLVERDVVLFPQGDPHVMSSAPGMRSPGGDKQFYFAPRPPQLPFAIDLHGSDGATAARLDGGGRDRTTLVCGFLGLDARPFNPLLAALPRVLHVPGATLGADSWVASFLRAAVVESNQRRPGGEAVLERMSEMLFVEVLRRYIDTLPAGETGWLAGMRDASVGRVLALLHERPAAPWTLERLAEDAALSRSTLHDRFVHFIGQPPMQYLAQWRMQVASGLLCDTSAKLIEIALRVGYESEAAFSRAFKRTVGVAPGAWRAGVRRSPPAPRSGSSGTGSADRTSP